MKTGTAEAFVRVDISESAQEPLIQQETFQHGPAGLQAGAEILPGYFHRIRSKTFQCRGSGLHQTKLTETA